MYQMLEDNGLKGFNFRVVSVAAFGFFASSYSLFATSTIWPALDFVYNDDWTSSMSPGVTFDLVTLTGIMIGMVLFGHLADRLGRKRLYGLELIIIVFATLGIVFSSDGYTVPPLEELASSPYYSRKTMNVFTAVTTWRFILGVGIGAGQLSLDIFGACPCFADLRIKEYPMSSIIAAEFVSTQSRGITIGVIFLMQSIGRMLAFGFANAFLQGQVNALGVNLSDPTSYKYGMKLAVDETWRFVAGFGGIFAVVALVLRLTIPESPRYWRYLPEELELAMMSNSEDGGAADANAGQTLAPGGGGTSGSLQQPNGTQQHPNGVQQQPTSIQQQPPTGIQQQPTGIQQQSSTFGTNSGSTQSQIPRKAKPQWFLGACRYATREPGRKRVWMLCVLWFLLDVCFYGTGLDSPSTLNVLWLSSSPPPANGPIDQWENDPANLHANIYDVLYNDGIRAILVSSISSFVGGVVILPLLNIFPRRLHLFWTSLLLAVIFIITGILVKVEYASPGSISGRVFYALAQLLFNLGPNTVIFVLAAEIFPTPFRGTLYGLSAASGKAGAMLVRPFVQMAASSGQKKDATPLMIMLIIFGCVMMGICWLTWSETSLPDVQEPQRQQSGWLKNRHLEDIAPNPRPGELSQRTRCRRARPHRAEPTDLSLQVAGLENIDLETLG
jgi:PHS family inorganic phosphate transporter-like MFS transporter